MLADDVIKVAVARHALLDVGEVAVSARRSEGGRHVSSPGRTQRVARLHSCERTERQNIATGSGLDGLNVFRRRDCAVTFSNGTE